MKTIATAILALSMFAASAAAGFAQDAMAGHDMSAMGEADQIELPEACVSAAGQEAAQAMPPMDMSATNMNEAQMAMMAGMEEMQRDMMMGSMAEDVDLAFYCGMIPHHQGAITMAKAELQYGDDEKAKAMAQKVIDAQQKDIEEMIAAIEELSKK